MAKTVAFGALFGAAFIIAAFYLQWWVLVVPVAIFLFLAPFSTSRKGDRDYRYDE